MFKENDDKKTEKTNINHKYIKQETFNKDNNMTDENKKPEEEKKVAAENKAEDDKREEEKTPEPSSTEIRDLLARAGLSLPAIEVMGPARLCGKLLRDNNTAPN